MRIAAIKKAPLHLDKMHAILHVMGHTVLAMYENTSARIFLNVSFPR